MIAKPAPPAAPKPSRKKVEKASRPADAPAAAQATVNVLEREGFEQRLLQEWGRARREMVPLSMLIIDVDHFRAYNDTHPAPQGEERLQAIAGALAQSVFRPTDVVARYGDDEFAILLPSVHEGGARLVAARVRSLVNALAMPHSGGVGGIVTVSVGVAAVIPRDDGEVQELVDLCLAALKQAKRMGRDCIVSQDWLS